MALSKIKQNYYRDQLESEGFFIRAFFKELRTLPAAFSWADTPQGYTYWLDLYIKAARRQQKEEVAKMLLSLGLDDLVPDEYKAVPEDLLWE